MEKYALRAELVADNSSPADSAAATESIDETVSDQDTTAAEAVSADSSDDFIEIDDNKQE
jgi:hypothetical protein